MKKLFYVLALAFASFGVNAQNQKDVYVKGRPAFVIGNDIICGTMSTHTCYIVHYAPVPTPYETEVTVIEEGGSQSYVAIGEFEVRKSDEPDIETVTRFSSLRRIDK